MAETTATRTATNTQAAPAPTQGRVLRRTCACGQHVVAGGECATCRQERLGRLRRSALGAGSATAIPPAVDTVLRSSGQPLGVGVRAEMETRFGRDFSAVPVRTGAGGVRASREISAVGDLSEIEADRLAAAALRPLDRRERPASGPIDFTGVRVHTGTDANRAAAAVDARAFAVGSHVVFGEGRFAPETADGRRLLAHELAHVVQEMTAPAPAARVNRSPCVHDGRATMCGASAGIWTFIDESVSPAAKSLFAIDDFVLEDGLKRHFGGEWARQVQTPPNLVKSGVERGRADGMKVIQGATLDVEVVEIKPRSPLGGGCARATAEVGGYLAELKRIAPLATRIANGLAVIGGMRLPSGKCRTPKAEEKLKLKGAGVDFANDDSVAAWCFLNSLQDRLGRTFASQITGINIRANADGAPGTTYDVKPAIPIQCRRKRKAAPPRMGLRHLVFQVNQKGGVSYGCYDECGDQEEKEKEKRKDVQPEQEVPKFRVMDTGTEDTEEDQPVQLPPEGVTEEDVLLETLKLTAALALLNEAAKKLKGRDLELAKNAARTMIERARAKGAVDAARMLNSKNVAKLGTDGYGKLIKPAEEIAERAAKKSPRFLKRFGPKAAKGLGRIAGPLAILLTAAEAKAMVDHVNKGGSIELGFSLDEKELAGDTKIEAKGAEGQPTPDVAGDVKLNDTIVDIEVKGVPTVSGRADITADKVTIKGAAGGKDGDSVSINFKGKISNSTIILKNTGTFQNGKIVVSGESTISDSTVVIDLPPGAVDPGSRKDGETTTLSGAKVTITSAGGSGGGAGAGGATGGPSATPGAGPGTAPGQTPTPVPGPTPATPATPSRQQLLHTIASDPWLLKVYRPLLGAEGVVLNDDALRRFIELKPLIERHPAAVEALLKTLKPGQITDPITQIIEPIEKRLLSEDTKLEAALVKAIAGPGAAAQPGAPPAGQQPPAGQPGQVTPRPGQTPAPGGTPGTGGAMANLGAVTPVTFANIWPQQFELPAYPSDAGATPPTRLSYPVIWRIHPQGSATELVYNIPLSLKFKRMLPAQTGYTWVAEYEFTPPAGAIPTEQGDRPIQFTDLGTRTVPIGLQSPKKK